jgi:uncharacterized membrane protein
MEPDLSQRLGAIEARLARIEAALGLSPAQAPPAPSAVAEVPASSASTPEPAAGADAKPANVPPPRPAYGRVVHTDVPQTPAPLPRWVAGGNALTRVGIVVLFFGVAFLLRYFAEIANVPIELKLAAAGLGGLVLAGIGIALFRRRPAYGLSLQGAGMGVVYLTVFAAFELYGVLNAVPAIAVLVAIAVATVALALRHDSQALAGLAFAGGFLAPILIRTDTTAPALLFGYFAIANGGIFALALKRAWRPLNVLGFVFTFVLGAWWGYRFYRPAHYAVVQPFLLLFFAFYVGIAILYARKGPLDHKAPVDGVLVFGVPIVGFALQMALVRNHRYGVALSAAALSTIYALLWWWLRARSEDGLALLARAFAVLALIFATLAIPFAVDARATSAWWALEAAGVYWLGAVQRQPLARAFALLLQLVAGLAFLIGDRTEAARPFLNAEFLGMALIGVAALASVWSADRDAERIGPRERSILPVVFAWGAAWWLLAGVEELRRLLPHPAHIDAALAWVSGSSGFALWLSTLLKWPRLSWVAAVLLPAMAWAAERDIRATHTTLTHFGWLVWPLAWLMQGLALQAAEALRSGPTRLQVREDFVRIAHTLSAIGFVAWAAWEASEWTGRVTAEGTVWIACAAAIPAIAYLFATTRLGGALRWPFGPHASAYGASAGTTIAALLFAWFAIVNVVSPGDPSPLPYFPLFNPLDLTLIAAIAAMAAWDRAWGKHGERTRLAWLGVAVLVALSGAVLRTAHHWGDVAWRLQALMRYKPAQAALTLTWTVTALALMLWATRRGVRSLWVLGAALLAAVVVKLFALDLAALSGLTRVIAFIGVGVLLLVIGYVAPLPPATAAKDE